MIKKQQIPLEVKKEKLDSSDSAFICSTKHISDLKCTLILSYKMTSFIYTEAFHIYNPVSKQHQQKCMHMTSILNNTQNYQKPDVATHIKICYLMIHMPSTVCSITVDT